MLFGSEICLKHIDSGYYVSGSEETLENLSGFKMIMSQTFTKDCVFKILPLRTFEHEGDLIFSNALFVIKNARFKCFVNVDK